MGMTDGKCTYGVRIIGFIANTGAGPYRYYIGFHHRKDGDETKTACVGFRLYNNQAWALSFHQKKSWAKLGNFMEKLGNRWQSEIFFKTDVV